MSPLAAARALIFDLDGTLVDSAADLADAVNEALADRSLPQWPVGTIRCWIGEGAERLMARALAAGNGGREPTAEATSAALADFRRIYAARCTRRTTLYPGAVEVLDAARAAGLPLAILTNKPAGQTETILRHFGLAERVATWLGGDSSFGRKPDPAPLVEIARRLGVAAADPVTVWMIGDSITDIRVAKAAGATAIVVRGGYDDAEPIDRCDPRPDRILASLNELPALFARGE